MTSAPYENNCSNTAQYRCVGCPVDLLANAEDRTDARNIVRAVLQDPENSKYGLVTGSRLEQGAEALLPAVDEKVAVFNKPHLTGVVVGAIALSVGGGCERPSEGI